MGSTAFTYVITSTNILMMSIDTYEQRIVDAMTCPRLYNRVANAIRSGDLDIAFEIMANREDETIDVDKIRAECVATITESRTNGRFTVESWTVGQEEAEWKVSYVPSGSVEPMYIHGKFFERILASFDDDCAMESLNRFLDAAESNPYTNIAPVDLFEFLAVNNHPITTDGHFLSFKIVRQDLYDLYTGKVYHGIGTEVALDPSEVNFNRSVTCSSGLHFCSKDYLPSYGGFYGRNEDSAVLIVKISPAEVAAFPRDYNNAKGRAVKYTVVAQMPAGEYTRIIESITSHHIIDEKDIVHICINAKMESNANRNIGDVKQAAAKFVQDVEQAAVKQFNELVAAAGPVPTIAHVGWIVMAYNTATKANIRCVANAGSRAAARAIAARYNEDFRTDSVGYRVWDNRQLVTS